MPVASRATSSGRQRPLTSEEAQRRSARWLQKFWNVTGAYFTGPHSVKVWAWLGGILLSVITGVRLSVLFSYQVNDLNSAVQVAVQGAAAGDESVKASGINGFWISLLIFCVIAAVLVARVLIDLFITQRFMLAWRAWLTDRLTGDWLDGRAYYRALRTARRSSYRGFLSSVRPVRFPTKLSRAALELVALPHCADRLCEVDDWAKVLSPGDQQRVAFARILLTKPKAVFLDEATSALDEPLEFMIYGLVRRELPETVFVSVTHRTTVNRHHEQHLELLGEGRWRFGPVESAYVTA